ncbi:MAG: hypothetical protein AB1489_19990 [Acidobacteriota bacterium]
MVKPLAKVDLCQERLNIQRILLQLFLSHFEKAHTTGVAEIDLITIAKHIGCTDLNLIGLAARQLKAELGEGVELTATIKGAVLWIK